MHVVYIIINTCIVAGNMHDKSYTDNLIFIQVLNEVALL